LQSKRCLSVIRNETLHGKLSCRAREGRKFDLIRIVFFGGATATIEPLNDSNYAQWRERIKMILGLSDMDYALKDAYPTESSIEDPLYEHKLMQYGINKVKWEKSSTKCVHYGRDHKRGHPRVCHR
jgi:hypothetical protein